MCLATFLTPPRNRFCLFLIAFTISASFLSLFPVLPCSFLIFFMAFLAFFFFLVLVFFNLFLCTWLAMLFHFFLIACCFCLIEFIICFTLSVVFFVSASILLILSAPLSCFFFFERDKASFSCSIAVVKSSWSSSMVSESGLAGGALNASNSSKSSNSATLECAASNTTQAG